MAEALGRAVTSSWLQPAAGKSQLRASREIVIDYRRRTLMVLAVPAKHRKVVAMLQRIFAEPAENLKVAAPAIPGKPAGPASSYAYDNEKIANVIRDLASEAGMNLVFRGPKPRATIDLQFKNVQTRDLLKLLLDIYNFNYQMSPNGETLVVFTGPTHRVMESYSIPAKIQIPLEEIAHALEVSILDVEEPYGPPEPEPLPAAGGAGGWAPGTFDALLPGGGGPGGGGGAPGGSGVAPLGVPPGGPSSTPAPAASPSPAAP
jgi:hypothetical protein